MKPLKKPDVNKQAFDKLTRARANLIIEQPFFGALALRLKLIEDEAVPTLAVNGRDIRYNPTFINSLEPSLVKSAVGHEVGHCVFAHMFRVGERDHRRWNIATDFVVNEMLKNAGFELGAGWLFNPAFAGMSADEIYAKIPPGDEGDEGGDGKEGGLCQLKPPGSGGSDSKDPQKGGSQSQDSSSTAKEERDWKVATIQAANAAKMAGKLPASLERFMDGCWDAKVDWRTLLRRFITQTSDADYTWARPNRRMLAHGHYLPKLWSESMGEIVVAVDTSGSISGPVLEAFSAEINAIIADTRPMKTHVIYCDAAVNRVDEFSPDDIIKLVGVGGGGTDFRPPFEYVEEHEIAPVCLVYLTDLYGPMGEEAEFPTLWVCISDVVAAWGETIKLEL